MTAQLTNNGRRQRTFFHFSAPKLLVLYRAATPPITSPPRPASLLPPVHEPRTIIITNYHPFSQLRARYGRPGGQKARRAYLATISPMSFLVSAAHTPAAYHLPIHIHINSHQYLKSLAGVTFRTRLTMATK